MRWAALGDPMNLRYLIAAAGFGILLVRAADARAAEACPHANNAAVTVAQKTATLEIRDAAEPEIIGQFVTMLRQLGSNITASPGGLLLSPMHISLSTNYGPEVKAESGYCVALNTVTAEIGYGVRELYLTGDVAKDECLRREVTAHLTRVARAEDSLVASLLPPFATSYQTAVEQHSSAPSDTHDKAVQNMNQFLMQPLTQIMSAIEAMREKLRESEDAAFRERASEICDGLGAAIFRVQPTQPKL